MSSQPFALQTFLGGCMSLAYFAATIAIVRAIHDVHTHRTARAIVVTGIALLLCACVPFVATAPVWHDGTWLTRALANLLGALAVAAIGAPSLVNARNRKQSLELRQAALVESERQSRSLAEALPQLIWTALPDGTVDYCNGRWLAYTGLTLDDCRRRGWEPAVHPDDVAKCRDAWTESVADGTPYEVEFRFRRASDETYRWHLSLALPVRDATGAVSKWFGTCTDIDDQKSAAASSERYNVALQDDLRARKRVENALRDSEERFRQVEEHAPIGLALVAPDGRFIRVNPALCALTGYSKDELLVTTFHLLTHPEDLATYLAHVQRMLDGTITSYVMEKRYMHKEGQSVWILLSWSLVRDENDVPMYFISQIQDISARKSAEHEAKSAKSAALEEAEAKSRFLATMSHEIRTPMNGIIGMTELLSLSELNLEQNQYVKVVRDSGESLLRVLNDILDYSKVEAGKLELENADFDLSSQVESVVALLEPQFQIKGVLLTMEIDAAIPPTLNGDAGRIRQILINLIGNALKFTPTGGCVELLVSSEASSESRMTSDAQPIIVRFEVRDSGVGIPADVKHRLFQPFSQVDGSTTRKHGGTGLGLAICKQLVDLMDGRIGVETAPNLGSSFWFTLPLRAGNDAEQTTETGPHEAGERRLNVRLRSERVLLAEDNGINALVAMKQFARLGFEIVVVPNGREAVEAVERDHYDLVFLDCHMPEMNGWNAARAIRNLASELRRRVPIIAMTADVQPADRQACLTAGMDDYVSKPSTLADLRTVLERWLPSGAVTES